MDALFTRILDGGDRVFYRHEQKGDEDLTEVEKREILSRVFIESKPVFLQRYLKWIRQIDVPLFEDSENPLVAYYINRLNKPPASEIQKKNRRYTALQKLKKEGVFFSDEKMRERDPLLYDRMVGRYLSEDERLHLRPTITATQANGWASLLSQFEESGDIARRRAEGANEEWGGIGQQKNSDRFMAHVSRAFEMEEEEEEDEEDLDSAGPVMSELQNEVNGIIKQMDEDTSREEAEEGEEEMEEDVPVETLRDEFRSIMEERFLSGGDSAFFDYSLVDEDEEQDYLNPIAERDREDAWFDED